MLPFTGANLTLVLDLAVGLLGAGLLLVLAGRMPGRLSFAGVPTPAFAPTRPGRSENRVVTEPASASPDRASSDYRVVVPGVGAFATVAEANAFVEERSRASRRESADGAESGTGYRVVRTEFGTFASARNGVGGASE